MMSRNARVQRAWLSTHSAHAIAAAAAARLAAGATGAGRSLRLPSKRRARGEGGQERQRATRGGGSRSCAKTSRHINLKIKVSGLSGSGTRVSRYRTRIKAERRVPVHERACSSSSGGGGGGGGGGVEQRHGAR